jgi:hypothetical protein
MVIVSGQLQSYTILLGWSRKNTALMRVFHFNLMIIGQVEA